MVIRLFDRHSVLTCVCILAVAVAVTMAVNFNRGQGIPASANVVSDGVPNGSGKSTVGSAAQAVPKITGTESEMRAVWVPYLSLNMSREDDKSRQAFLNKFNKIIENAKKCGMNTLIVQVRPFGDALYQSSYFPWSHIVGGTQGVNPGYDPLALMVEASHSAGLQIHAWVNPLRIQVNGTPSILAVGNLYNTWKKEASRADWVVDSGDGKYFNPAYADVRNVIADGVQEIARNYQVDGIQFDDYFYPTQDVSFDKKAYDAYCETAQKTGTPLSLLEWRRANVSAMVSLTYRKIKSVKPALPFGIAPQANVQNDLNMGADVRAWCAVSGYVDYICPQLHVNFQNPVLPYDAAAKTWKQMVTNRNVKLYFGLAAYKAGSDVDSGTWKQAGNILASQVEYGRRASCDGFMFYSCDYLDADQTKQEIQNVVEVLKR